MAKFDIWFNSGTASVNHYTKGDNISLISITDSDESYYQNGTIVLFGASSQSVGDTVRVDIDDSEQFNGYVARKQQSIKGGKQQHTYQLVGKTYDLWRYVTDTNALYSGTTTYIASSLVSSYCPGISGNFGITGGTTITNEIDLTQRKVGDAIGELTKLDGCSFYIDNDDKLNYYKQSKGTYDFTIQESDIIDMEPIEEADEDLVNDVLVIGGSGYSQKTNVSRDHQSSKLFPSDVLVAQRFTAEDPRLSAVKLYLDRSIDPYQPGDLLFEIWENTEITLFEDNFTNWNYLDSYQNLGYKLYGTSADSGKIRLLPAKEETHGYVMGGANKYPNKTPHAFLVCFSSNKSFSRIQLRDYNDNRDYIHGLYVMTTGNTGAPDENNILASTSRWDWSAGAAWGQS